METNYAMEIMRSMGLMEVPNAAFWKCKQNNPIIELNVLIHGFPGPVKRTRTSLHLGNEHTGT
jgi:hypothetical protein